MDQPTLTTRRLTLRPFLPGDAVAVQKLAGVAEVSGTTLNIPHPYPDGLAEGWIASHAALWDAGTAVTFAIVTHDDEMRGAAGLQIARQHSRAEMGYWIGRPWWGQGLATEAAACLLRFGFEQLELNRIQATHLTRNPASGRVMEKLGMTREGLHRERYRKDGRFEDVVHYALLRRDWSSP